jgi:hypothetical protein
MVTPKAIYHESRNTANAGALGVGGSNPAPATMTRGWRTQEPLTPLPYPDFTQESVDRDYSPTRGGLNTPVHSARGCEQARLLTTAS